LHIELQCRGRLCVSSYKHLVKFFQKYKFQIESPGGYPVLVWVHGGGFCIGNAILYGFKNLSNNFVKQDIIVITVQYRLGHLGWYKKMITPTILGFLSTGDEIMPGNYGLWDLAQAFKFIHENIQEFGGDPKKITAWGLSAGGALVSALSLSPHSRGSYSYTWGRRQDLTTEG
jgi:carboxylesterase type B